MEFDDVISRLKQDELSEDARREKIKELQEEINAQNHLHDDFGPTVIGERDAPPKH